MRYLAAPTLMPFHAPSILCILAAPLVALAARSVPSEARSRPAAEFASYEPVLAISPGLPGKVVLRRYRRSGRDSVLAIDPSDLQTETDAAPADLELVDWNRVRAMHGGSAWMKAMDEVRRSSGTIQDAGIRHADADESGIDLTIDLCPSRKPLDRAFFRDVLAALDQEESPVPIGLSVSGLWMTGHRPDLAWLKSLAAAGRIRPVWIDHSYHHRVDPKASLSRNFLLEPGTDLAQEVFLTEREMLHEGLVPSPFFRFPGLVSRDSLVERLLSWGLVPVGSDAWLAKNQKARDGSIVLVHANGNEPLGLMRFRILLHQHREAIHARHWLLYDLRQGFSTSP